MVDAPTPTYLIVPKSPFALTEKIFSESGTSPSMITDGGVLLLYPNPALVIVIDVIIPEDTLEIAVALL